MSHEIKTLPSGIVIENKPNGVQKYAWFIKGTNHYHNENEPAVEHKNGDKHWFQHDKHHRLDGPGSVDPGGFQFYWINGERFEENEYWNHPDVLAYQYIKTHPELAHFI